MTYSLSDTVVELLAFLALSDDKTIDPDSAVTQLEAAVAMLRELEPSERDQFVQRVRRELASRDPRSPERTRFLESLMHDVAD